MRVNNSVRFAILLAALALPFLVLPLVTQAVDFPELPRLVFTTVLLAAVIGVSGSRRVLGWSIAGAAVAIGLGWWAEISRSSVLYTCSQSMSALFVLYVVALIFWAVTRSDSVDLGTVLGGVCIYLLLVVSFSQLHGLIEHLQDGAYLINGEPLANWAAGGSRVEFLATMLYFSLTTITTTGYGDIVPAVPMSRMLAGAEAVIGQLYLAIFIARLVGLYTAQSLGRVPSPAHRSGELNAAAAQRD